MRTEMYSRTSVTISNRGNLKFHDAFADEGALPGFTLKGRPPGRNAAQENARAP